MVDEQSYKTAVANFFDNLIKNPSTDSTVARYPLAFRVPLIISASLMAWAVLVSGIEGNAARQHNRQPQPAFHVQPALHVTTLMRTA